jgi:hypothetical protein
VSGVRDLERLRGFAGTEFNKIGYVERRAGAYDLIIDLCRIRAELSWESTLFEEVEFAERAKSRAFAEQLGSRTDLPQPAAVPRPCSSKRPVRSKVSAPLQFDPNILFLDIFYSLHGANPDMV